MTAFIGDGAEEPRGKEKKRGKEEKRGPKTGTAEKPCRLFRCHRKEPGD
jgi:hypothetical protein